MTRLRNGGDQTFRPRLRLPQFICDTTVERESSEAIIEERDRYDLEVYWLVASPKFAGRYYLVWEEEGELRCTSHEPQMAAECIALVQAFRAERKTAPAAGLICVQ